MSEDKKSLRSLIEETTSLEILLVESQGEITEEISKVLEIKETQVPGKVDRYDYFIQRMKFLSEEYKRQAEPLLRISKSLEKLSTNAEDNLKQMMVLNQMSELEGFDIKYKISPTKPTVGVLDEEKVPEEYKKTKVTVTVDKASVLEAVKSGIEVAGIEIQPSFSLRRYPNIPIKKVK